MSAVRVQVQLDRSAPVGTGQAGNPELAEPIEFDAALNEGTEAELREQLLAHGVPGDARVLVIVEGRHLALSSVLDGSPWVLAELPNPLQLLALCDVDVEAGARRRIRPRKVAIIPDRTFFDGQSAETQTYEYAVSEFIDNSIQATRENPPGREKRIELHFDKAANEITFFDNGSGMDNRGIDKFATYNKSANFDREREERPPSVGAQPSAAGRRRGNGSASASAGEDGLTLSMCQEITQRLMNAKLSRHGMGAKRGGFYLGDQILVRTKTEEDELVSCLSMDNGVIRQMGMNTMQDACNDIPTEEERELGSFTRITIRNVKARIWEEYNREKLCEFICNKHHFYLAGAFESGIRREPAAAAGPSSGPGAAGLAQAARPPWKILLYDDAIEPGADPVEVGLLPHFAPEDDLEIRAVHKAILADPKSAFVERLELCTVVLAYFPKQKGVETLPVPPGPIDLELEDGPLAQSHVYAIWDGLRLKDMDKQTIEYFLEQRRLPFMEVTPKEMEQGKATRKVKRDRVVDADIPLQCFTRRVAGFVFIDPSILPGTQKQNLTPGVAKLQTIFPRDPRDPANQKLAKRYSEWIDTQHKRDQEVQFVEHNQSEGPAEMEYDDGELVMCQTWTKIRFMGQEYKKGDVVVYQRSADAEDGSGSVQPRRAGRGRPRRAKKAGLAYGTVLSFIRRVEAQFAQTGRAIIRPLFPRDWEDEMRASRASNTQDQKVDIECFERAVVRPGEAEEAVRKTLPACVKFLVHRDVQNVDAPANTAITVPPDGTVLVGAQFFDGDDRLLRQRAGGGVVFSLYRRERPPAEAQAAIDALWSPAEMAVESRLRESLQAMGRFGHLVYAKHSALSDLDVSTCSYRVELRFPLAGSYRLVAFPLKRPPETVANSQDVNERRNFSLDERVKYCESTRQLVVPSGAIDILKACLAAPGQARDGPQLAPLRRPLPAIRLAFFDKNKTPVDPAAAPVPTPYIYSDKLQLETGAMRTYTDGPYRVVEGLQLAPKEPAREEERLARGTQFEIAVQVRFRVAAGPSQQPDVHTVPADVVVRAVPGLPARLEQLASDVASSAALPRLRFRVCDADGFHCSTSAAGLHIAVRLADDPTRSSERVPFNDKGEAAVDVPSALWTAALGGSNVRLVAVADAGGPSLPPLPVEPPASPRHLRIRAPQQAAANVFSEVVGGVLVITAPESKEVLGIQCVVEGSDGAADEAYPAGKMRLSVEGGGPDTEAEEFNKAAAGAAFELPPLLYARSCVMNVRPALAANTSLRVRYRVASLEQPSLSAAVFEVVWVSDPVSSFKAANLEWKMGRSGQLALEVLLRSGAPCGPGHAIRVRPRIRHLAEDLGFGTMDGDDKCELEGTTGQDGKLALDCPAVFGRLPAGDVQLQLSVTCGAVRLSPDLLNVNLELLPGPPAALGFSSAPFGSSNPRSEGFATHVDNGGGARFAIALFDEWGNPASASGTGRVRLDLMAGDGAGQPPPVRLQAPNGADGVPARFDAGRALVEGYTVERRKGGPDAVNVEVTVRLDSDPALNLTGIITLRIGPGTAVLDHAELVVNGDLFRADAGLAIAAPVKVRLHSEASIIQRPKEHKPFVPPEGRTPLLLALRRGRPAAEAVVVSRSTRAEAVNGDVLYEFVDTAAPKAAGLYDLHLVVADADFEADEDADGEIFGGRPRIARLKVSEGPGVDVRVDPLPRALRPGEPVDVAVYVVDAHGNEVVCNPPAIVSLAVVLEEQEEEPAPGPSSAKGKRRRKAARPAPTLYSGDGKYRAPEQPARFQIDARNGPTSAQYSLVVKFWPMQGGEPVTVRKPNIAFVSAADKEKAKGLTDEIARLQEAVTAREEEAGKAKKAASEAAAKLKGAQRPLEQLRKKARDLFGPEWRDGAAWAAGAVPRLQARKAEMEAERGRPARFASRPAKAILEAQRKRAVPGYEGLVVELGSVEDPREAEALALVLGPRAEAAVFRTQEHVNAAEKRQAFRGLRALPIESQLESRFCPKGRVQGGPQGLLKFDAAKDPAEYGGQYMVNVLRLAEDRVEYRRTLFYMLLRDGVLFGDADGMQRYLSERLGGVIACTLVAMIVENGRLSDLRILRPGDVQILGGEGFATHAEQERPCFRVPPATELPEYRQTCEQLEALEAIEGAQAKVDAAAKRAEEAGAAVKSAQESIKAAWERLAEKRGELDGLRGRMDAARKAAGDEEGGEEEAPGPPPKRDRRAAADVTPARPRATDVGVLAAGEGDEDEEEEEPLEESGRQKRSRTPSQASTSARRRRASGSGRAAGPSGAQRQE